MELLTFLPLIIIMGAFMFFASRRQRKAMQAIRFAQQVEQYDHRLELEKLALKQNMMKALQKPAKKQDGTPEAEDQGNAKQNLI